MDSANRFLQSKLQERQIAGNYRQLKRESGLVDFCSNDYLGFARSKELKDAIEAEIAAQNNVFNGSTGSRLLAGNTSYAESLEAQIANAHGYAAGLIYNSGYDANVGLLSCLPQRGDTIITDELVHASIIDGARLSHANRYKFKHNYTAGLEQQLKQAKGNVYVVVESIYSMDGDTAPLVEICRLTRQYSANLIVDEAHATGVFGLGLIHQLNLQSQVFAQVVTFGKALGCHGAIILGTDLLRNYLINFSRSFIYTTAAPLHSLAAAKMAHQQLAESASGLAALKQNIVRFTSGFQNSQFKLISSNSAIQCILLGSNELAKQLSALLQFNGYDVRPILSPTVAAGSERLRICLHSYNTPTEITGMLNLINNFAG